MQVKCLTHRTGVVGFHRTGRRRSGLLPGEPVLFDLVVEGGRPQARNAPASGVAARVGGCRLDWEKQESQRSLSGVSLFSFFGLLVRHFFS